jgi:DNA (cytosine-5)-methyltransferase 1
MEFVSALAVDSHSSSLDVYRANFHPMRALLTDIRSLLDGRFGSHATANERDLVRGLPQIEMLLAGPPCQGYSNLNNHTRRRDERNELYERVARFAEIARPRNLLIENVPAIVHSREREVERTVDRLMAIGYSVDAAVVDLSLLGVPQRRKRHVLLAKLDDDASVQAVVYKFRVPYPRDVRWAIRDLERVGACTFMDRPTMHSGENKKRIDYLFERDLLDLPDRMRPKCHRNGHTYKSMYGRLRYDDLAQTITSGFTSPGQGRYIHPAKRRTLTPHEAARLQLFPDWFEFGPARTRAALATMIGNAVPMKLSFAFCLDILSL